MKIKYEISLMELNSILKSLNKIEKEKLSESAMKELKDIKTKLQYDVNKEIFSQMGIFGFP